MTIRTTSVPSPMKSKNSDTIGLPPVVDGLWSWLAGGLAGAPSGWQAARVRRSGRCPPRPRRSRSTPMPPRPVTSPRTRAPGPPRAPRRCRSARRGSRRSRTRTRRPGPSARTALRSRIGAARRTARPRSPPRRCREHRAISAACPPWTSNTWVASSPPAPNMAMKPSRSGVTDVPPISRPKRRRSRPGCRRTRR